MCYCVVEGKGVIVLKVGDVVRSKGAQATGWISREHPLWSDAVWVNWFDGSSVFVSGCVPVLSGQETLVYKDNLELVET